MMNACLPEHNSVRNWGVSGRAAFTDDSAYVQAEGDTVAYILAVEYPDGRSWQDAGEYASCRLSVFASQKRIITVPAGEGTLLTPSTDRNRLIDGHLYSDAFDGGETVLFRDGKELFRYSGKEFIQGIQVSEEGIYTLGQSYSTEGFSLRLNGLELFSRAGGTIVGGEDFSVPCEGALFRAEEGLSFGYMSNAGDFYLVRGQSAELVRFQDEIVKVLDIRYMDGEYYIAAIRQDGRLAVYSSGKRLIVFDLNDAPFLFSARLVAVSGAIYIKVHFHLGESGERLYVWDMRGRTLFREESYVNLYLYGGEWLYYCPPEDGFETQYARRIPLSSTGDRLYSPYCAVFKDGHRYAAVTATDSMMYPYLLKDGRRLAIAVNGYLIDLEVVP